MLPNPYTATNSTAANVLHRRSVALLVSASLLTCILAVPPLATGLVLVNQEFSIWPTTHMFYDIEFNGVRVSNRTFIGVAILIGVLLLSIAMLLGLRAWQNHRFKKPGSLDSVRIDEQ